MRKIKHLVVGAGLSGAVMAERIAGVLNEPVLVIDARGHIGGNCFDYRDKTAFAFINTDRIFFIPQTERSGIICRVLPNGIRFF